MSKCIYLNKTEPEVTFHAGEHIIPAGIGGVKKLDMGMVSDEFNTKIFSPIELDFMRNSIISLPRQLQGPGKRGALSEKKATKSDIHLMSKDGSFADATLGYIKLARPYLIPQLRIIRDGSVRVIFDKSEGDSQSQSGNFAENLKTFDNKYKEILNDKLPDDCMLLGVFKGKWYLAKKRKEINFPLDRIITQLIDLLLSSERQIYCDKAQVTCHQNMGFNIEYYFRVCAKITFNTLAFLRGSDFVLDSKFDPLRNWVVNGGENKFASLSEGAPVRNNVGKGVFFPNSSHTVLISKVNKQLWGFVCLYGYFEVAVLLCDNFSDRFDVDGFICDWESKKEYRLIDYIVNSNMERE